MVTQALLPALPAALPAAIPAAILASLVGFFGTASAQPLREEIAAVEFAGNTTFADSELRRAVLTTASSCPPLLTITTCALGIDWFRDRQYLSSRVLGDDVDRVPELLKQPETIVHLYGKAEVRPGRKMGHVTRLTPRGSETT